jgi:thiosulfate dehydrogenase
MRKFWLGFFVGLLGLPVLILLLANFGIFSPRARVQPPHWEMEVGRTALNASVARHAPQISNPFKGSNEEILAGMKVYLSNCAGCHGDPSGPSQFGLGFYPPVPQFPLNPPMKPDYQMFYIVKNGVKYSGMPSWEGVASEKDMWLAVTFLSHLRSLPPEIQVKWNPKQKTS